MRANSAATPRRSPCSSPGGKKLAEIQGAKPWNLGPKKQNMTALFLTPVPITKDNLDVVIDAGWVTKDVVCQGVKAGSREGLQLIRPRHDRSASIAGRRPRSRCEGEVRSIEPSRLWIPALASRAAG